MSSALGGSLLGYHNPQASVNSSYATNNKGIPLVGERASEKRG